MKNKLKKFLTLGLIGLISSSSLAYGQTNFKDADKISPWAKESVEALAAKEIIRGDNGYYRPKDGISRSEFVTIMAKILNLEEVDKSISFTDVKEDDWFKPYLDRASSAGIISGSQGKFRPKEKIKREEMAAIVSRSLNLKTSSQTSIRDLDRVSNWALEDVRASVEKGLILGDDKGNFNPKETASREMVAVVAKRIEDLDREIIEEVPEEKPEEKPVESLEKLDLALDKTGDYLLKNLNNPGPASIGGDWAILGLSQGKKLDEKTRKIYLSNLKKVLDSNKDKEYRLHRVKKTENARVILSLKSLGLDPKNIYGYNLYRELYDLKSLEKQGINGPLFTLIALGQEGKEVSQLEVDLVSRILDRQSSNGSWSLGMADTEGDIDLTAMVLQSLSGYRANKDVEKSIESALDFLSEKQEANGGYKSWGSENSENLSQTIIALSSLGIDPAKDPRFIKNGKSLLDRLEDFSQEDGGYSHELGGKTNQMATEQAYLALLSYQKLVKDGGYIYRIN